MTEEPVTADRSSTPEGHTPEKPASSEIGEPGEPGEPGTPGAADPPDHTATHMDAPAQLSDDDHGHAEAALGSIDWRAWAFALIGAAAGVLVVLAFWAALT